MTGEFACSVPNLAQRLPLQLLLLCQIFLDGDCTAWFLPDTHSLQRSATSGSPQKKMELTLHEKVQPVQHSHVKSVKSDL